MGKPTPHQVGRAGEHIVAAEILRRGGHASTFAGNMPDIDVLAADKAQERTVWIQVKTKRGGRDWQTSTTRGRARQPEEDPIRFWVLVDLAEASPRCFVMPEWWIQNKIDEAHKAYLARHGGQRARTRGSTHHAIPIARVAEWEDRWELLNIF